ncbi:hypothetical protein O181_096982 [Austropuccinia psidii MF-1]|uniref:Uncharacterized protein n=1 Tax=Austropuccinia psidii MF-1 TaxID=1389203 RepID=A0A9Q3J8C6_9BASI|nr:hypothetical protein [Austropuccinia psidii MF-1]
MEISKDWNPNRKFRLLEEWEAMIRKNKVATQDIEEQLKQTGNTLIPEGLQGVKETDSPMAPHHSGIRKSAMKSHHSSL